MTEPKPDSLAVADEKLLDMGKVKPPTVREPNSEAGAIKEAPTIDQTGSVATEPEKGTGVASLPDISPKPVPSDYVSAPDALNRIRREMAGIFQCAAARVDAGELKLIGWGLTQPRVQKLAAEHEAKPWFFVGDIHGDFLAWHRLFERVRQEKDFRLCFLGDLVDRGPLHLECFAALLEAVEQHPDRILWILGNHDEGVRYVSKPEKHFESSVEPGEFAEYLNTNHEGVDQQQKQAWGDLFIDVCRRLPRAVLFGDGLLATHGGVPLQDRWDTLGKMEAFHHQRSLGDFTWSRATSYPSKLGWKYDRARRATSSAFEFGYRDLEGFCRAVETVFPVKRVVRGHDHVENGFETPEKYKSIPLLTINGFGFNYLTNSVADYRLKLALGVGVPGDLPRVEPVSYLPEEYTGVYPLTIK